MAETPTNGPVRAWYDDREVVVTDPETGGQKGMKQAQLGAIDPEALYTLAKVAGLGTSKYSRNNYRRGYAWSLSYDAAQRHMMRFWAGEDIDPESGLPHVAHAAWHMLALLTFQREHPSFDDRYKEN